MAERCFRNALKANPFNEEAMMALISIYADDCNWNSIWDLSNKLIIYTDSAEAYLLRAQCGIETGRLEQCLQDLAEYEQKGGDRNSIYDLRGQIALKSGDYEKALEHFETMMKSRKAADEPCYDDLAVCMCKLGRADEAAEMLGIVCASSKNVADHILLYQMQMYDGEFKAAKDTLKQCRKKCKISRIDEEYSFLMATLLLESGKIALAQGLAESINSREGERLCGIIEMLLNNYRQSIKIF